ncbi:uncharacterized protein LOC106868481 isoform X1 [Octopus bimaculoides]|uniref:USP domain-containing protein n=1 Tax=Octopus bimaculoides TaxID=37653 RepID=A0A0L8HUM6_OCTBM|nr:uncharacterized protein LOC106868481 isoform X1 [Octopus bimaculoides]|eukprot:XP_014769253.1 PREDICTED: uncharacterized protein LOC106868481 isoform X1 [Octopus bimaculoides]
MEIEDLSQLPETYLNGWDRHHSLSLATTKGLRNPPGENNCFLNSAVQVFWHLDVFRRSFKNYNGHVCMGNSCIFCNLKVIFTQLRYSDKSSLHPNALRRALAEAFVDQHRFQLGHMDDAAECFENILRRIHFHIANGYSEDQCTATHCLTHRKFALTVSDQVQCVCGASSKPLVFSEIVHYVSVAALVNQANKIIESGCKVTSDKFGLLLRNACSVGDVRDCPKSCGRKVNIRRTLHNQPDVVSIGLVWDTDRPSGDLVSDVLTNIRTSIVLEDMFHCSKIRDLAQLHLVGIVCYYGKHYSTFVFHSRDRSWYYFDDATVKEMGPSWDSVVEKCCRGHYQPLLLIYANPNATPINVAEAPRKTVMAPGYNNSSTGAGILRSQSADIRRAVTPTPDMHCYIDPTFQHRRSITPGPETYYRLKDLDRDSVTSSNAEHQRQASFLTAVSGSDDTASNHSSVKSFPLDSVSLIRSLSPSVSNPSSKPSSIASESVDQNLLGEYICTEGRLQASFYNSSNSNSCNGGVYNVQRSNLSDFSAQRRSSPSLRDKSFENVHSENFITEGSTPNDFGYRKPIDSHVLHSVDSKYRDVTSPPRDTYKTQSKAYDNIKHSHLIVKPTVQSTQQDNYYENIKCAGPLHSGLATLPRNKDSAKEKKQLSQQAQLSYSRPSVSLKCQTPPRFENGHQYNRYRSNHPSFNHSSNSIPKPGNMIRSISAHSLASPNNETYVSKDRTYKIPSQDHEDSYSQENYIDRKTVEHVMKKLYTKPPKGTINGLRHSNRIKENLNGLGNIASATELSEALTLEIPYDRVSLESQRDSGYGSSDRNSSSSSSSITMDPYGQYLPSKGIQSLSLSENQKFSSNVEKNSVYSGFAGNIGNRTGNKNMYLGRKGSIDSILNEPLYPSNTFLTDLICENVSMDIKSSLMQQGKKILPDKPLSGHIVRDAKTKAIISPHPNPSPANGNDLINFKSGIQNNMNSMQGNKGPTSEDEYIRYCCLQADNMMDNCLAAEAKGDLRCAICDCDKAIGYCKQILELVNIPHQSVVFMQNKLHCCVLKRRSLYNKYSTKQQQAAAHCSVGPSLDESMQAEKIRNSMAGHLPSNGSSSSSSCSNKKDNLNTSISSISCPNYQQQKHVASVNNDKCLEKHFSDSNQNSSKLQYKMSSVASREVGKELPETVDSWSNANVYGTLPKNKPRQIVSKVLNQEAEVYQMFLNRQKQLNKENNSMSSYMSTGCKAFSPNSQINSNMSNSCSNLNKTRPSSTISQPHSRSDSVDSSANSLISCDSAVTTISTLHSRRQNNSPAMNRPYRQDTPTITQCETRTYQHGSGTMYRNTDESHVKPEQSTTPQSSHFNHSVESFKSVMGQESSETNVGTRTNVVSNTSGFSSCLTVSHFVKSSLATAQTTPSVVPSTCQPPSAIAVFKTNTAQTKPNYSENSFVLPFQSRTIEGKKNERIQIFSTVRHNRPLADACFQTACFHKSDGSSITNGTADTATKNTALKVSESNSETFVHLANSQNLISERLCASDDEDFVRPSVKDLASKFEYDVTNKISDSVDGNGNLTQRRSFRVRSKSESSTMKPKPALSKHQFQQGSRPRKSVTFADNIAMIAPNNKMYTSHDANINQKEKSTNEKYDWDDDSSSSSEDPTELTNGPFCNLCQKKGVQQGQVYCQDCDFYMSRFKPCT